MLVRIFLIVIGIFHLCAIRDRHIFQLGIEFFGCFTPNFLRMFGLFFGPCAERNKKNLSLQSLAGMYRHDTDCICSGHGDRLAMQYILPINKESLQIATICGNIISCLIQESIDIRRFFTFVLTIFMANKRCDYFIH